MDEGYKDHGTSRFEQDTFVNHVVGKRVLSFRLAHHHQIEAPANTAYLISCTGDAGTYDASFRRYSRALGNFLEAGDGVTRLFVGFNALTFDDFRRNAAYQRAGDHGFIRNGDTKQVSIKCFSHRDSKFARRIAIAEAQINDNVLDHEQNLLAGE